MSLMQDLYVGVSGLTVSQRAISTTAHNLSNVETDGFVRQQTVMESSTYVRLGYTHVNYTQVGIGVDTGAVYQVRDQFLDKAYRQESGREAFYNEQYNAINEIEELFGELQGVAFQDTLEDFWSSLQELAKEPSSLVARSTLVETAVSLVDRTENISSLLNRYQMDLDTKIKESVDRINEIGAELVKLNDKICYYECNGVEHANDLRDQRNILLDELGGMVAISYHENEEGRMSVSVEGIPFVTEDTCFRMDTIGTNELEEKQMLASGLTPTGSITNTGTDMLVPVWPAYGYAEVCDISQLSTSEKQNDVGSLRGLLVTRGTKVGRYTDIPVEPTKEEYTETDGTFLEDDYNAAMTQFDKDMETYRVQVEQSIIVTAQAQFDRLINGITTTINDLLCPNKEVTLDDGTVIKILDEENAAVGMDEAATMGEALFNRKSVPRYQEEQEITLEDGSTITARIYNEEDFGDNYSLFTLGEIEVNAYIKENLSKLPLSSNSGSGDFDIETCQKLMSAWQEPFSTLTPDTLTRDNFNEYYNEFIGSIANRGEQVKTISKNQTEMTENINEQRLSVTGVSSDEELTNLIKYQHAYNANSRYINVVDEMLQHLLERL